VQINEFNKKYVPFISVPSMVELVRRIGLEAILRDLASYIAADFRRWEQFEKVARLASHSPDGVIELMPASDGLHYAFKYVNGHPKNSLRDLQTVAAFGMLADVASGYPILLSEMTLLTALRTAATSALAAYYLARPDSRTMALIGNGAQSEFQAFAFKTLLGIAHLRIYDIDSAASLKLRKNLEGSGLSVMVCASVDEAVRGADIITTITADKRQNIILSDNHVGTGVHINAVGGDCPGKTELSRDILLKSDIVAEFPPQTRIEGEIQQLPPDYPVRELWQIIAEHHAPDEETGARSCLDASARGAGRAGAPQITLFDSVGFALEDFSALRYVYDKARQTEIYEKLDMIAHPADPRNLFGLLLLDEEA